MSEYLQHWQIQSPVFGVLAAAEIYQPPSLARELHRLRLYCEQPARLVALLSAPGNGKTTVAAWLRKSLPPASHEVLYLSLYQSETRTGWLLPKLNRFLGIPIDSAKHPSTALDSVAEGLDEIHREGRRFLLIIDDADRLTNEAAFSELSGLVAMQRAVSPCLSVLLVGDQGLGAGLNQASLRHRLSLRIDLAPLLSEEALGYLHFRLRLAGLSPETFSAAAAAQIVSASGGIFSHLDAFAEQAMLEAFLAGSRVVESTHLAKTTVTIAAPQPTKNEAPTPAALQPTPAPSASTSIPAPTPARKPLTAETTGKDISLSSLFLNDGD